VKPVRIANWHQPSVFFCKTINFHTRELLAHEAHRVLPPGKGDGHGSLTSADCTAKNHSKPVMKWLTDNDDCQSLLTTIIFKTYVNVYKYPSVVYNLKHTA